MSENSEGTGARGNPLLLSGYQQTMIVLSDAAARARISAADGAASNYPRLNLFGWYTVLISGLATLLITLKASMNPREVRKPGEPIKWGDIDTLRNGMIVFLGIAAIICSTAGTVLNGVKVFYDPTAAYIRNTAALVKARQLHQEIALSFIDSFDPTQCGAANLDARQVKEWSNTMADLQQQILKAAVPIPGLDGTTTTKTNQQGNGSASGQQASAAPPPAGQPGSAPPVVTPAPVAAGVRSPPPAPPPASPNASPSGKR